MRKPINNKQKHHQIVVKPFALAPVSQNSTLNLTTRFKILSPSDNYEF